MVIYPFNTTKTTRIFANYLINNLSVIDFQKKEDLDTDISFYINRVDKDTIQNLMKKKHTTLSVVIRQIFDNLELLMPLQDFDNKLNRRMKIQVSDLFKKEFAKKAQELNMTSSELVRSIVRSLI